MDLKAAFYSQTAGLTFESTRYNSCSVMVDLARKTDQGTCDWGMKTSMKLSESEIYGCLSVFMGYQDQVEFVHNDVSFRFQRQATAVYISARAQQRNQGAIPVPLDELPRATNVLFGVLKQYAPYIDGTWVMAQLRAMQRR